MRSEILFDLGLHSLNLSKLYLQHFKITAFQDGKTKNGPRRARSNHAFGLILLSC